jgi:bile acid-coenzyme A ligase
MTEGEIFAMPPGGPGSSYRYIGAERRATPDGWESVGDVGHVDADGYLYLADRRADLIISGGVNIWPAEVEAALLLHPAIHSCAVVGLADEDLGQRVHAIVESDDPALDIDSLRLFLADRLSREKYPRSLNIQPTPVRDDAGKVRKSASIAQRTPQ